MYLVLMDTETTITPYPADHHHVSSPASMVRNSSSVYHADLDIPSSSMLKTILVSPAHLLADLTRRRHSKAMDWGTALHALVLEPASAMDVIAICPDPMTTARGKAFTAANEDRVVLSMTEWLELQVAARTVLDTVFRGRPFYRFVEEGKVEHSIYYTDPTTGIRCRTRPDLFHPEFTFDIKSTRYNSASSFQRDAVDLHYDLQAFMYSYARVQLEGEATQSKPFVFVPVESQSPHTVYFRPAGENFLANGARKYVKALSLYAACSKVDHWPTKSAELEMDLLPWQELRE